MKKCPFCGKETTLFLITDSSLREQCGDYPELFVHDDSWAVICDMNHPDVVGASGVVVLDQIDQQLDELLENWRKTLLDNLGDPTARRSIQLLPDAQREAVDAFLNSQRLPEKISNDLVQGMQQALSGLIAIPVRPADLLDALGDSGAPCTIAQIQARFEEFVRKITHGKEPAKVRLVIDRGESSETL